MTHQGRALTPPQYIEIHRYWDKVEQILDHFRNADGCTCGEKYNHDAEWAQHLADVLFPHRGVHDGR